MEDSNGCAIYIIISYGGAWYTGCMFRKPLRPLLKKAAPQNRSVSSLQAAIRQRRVLAAAEAVVPEPAKSVVQHLGRMSAARINRLQKEAKNR